MVSTFKTSDDVELVYELRGVRDAPIVLFSHCFGSNHRYWDCHLPAVSDYRTLRYDTRGHGQSDAPAGPYTLARLVQDVVDLLDALAIEQVHFVGVSMGGMIGQQLALTHQKRLLTLTLANSPCSYNASQVALWRERAQLVLDQGIEAVKPALMRRWFTDQAALERPPGYNFISAAFSAFNPQSFAAATAAICEINTDDSLHRITVPTLLYGSPDDPGVPVAVSEFMASKIPNAELHWLAPSRHLASLEQVDTFNSTLRQFLQHNQ